MPSQTLSPRAVQDAITPLNGYLAVKPKKVQSNSPIIVPDSIKAPCIVEVVASAKDVSLIKPGDTVVIPLYSGSRIEISGEEFLFIKATDVLGKVTC